MFLTILDDGDDTCTELPDDEYIQLPPGCSVDLDGSPETIVNVGQCSNEACSRRHSPDDINTHCCGSTASEDLTVTCTYLSYDISRITKCGCAECTEGEKQEIVTINGQIFMITLDENTREKPGYPIRFSVGEDLYQAIPGGRFRFSMLATSDTVVLSFEPEADDTYMSQVVSIQLVPGVTSYHKTVVLLTKPEPVRIDPTSDNTLDVTSGLDNETAILLTLPANSFVDDEGRTVNETVSCYIQFLEPSINNSHMAYAPGTFSSFDNEGNEQLLITHGVINFMAFTISGTRVNTAVNTFIEINPAGLGLSDEDMGRIYTWSLDESSGTWYDPRPLTVNTGRKKRRTKTNKIYNGVLGTNLRRVNLDEIHLGTICEMSVFVTQDRNRIFEAVGVSLILYSEGCGHLDQGWGVYITNQMTTNKHGAACGWVDCSTSPDCGRRFEITSLNKDFIPSLDQHVFSDFGEEINDNNNLVGKSPKAGTDKITNDEGPVYNRNMCNDRDIGKYHMGFYNKNNEVWPTSPKIDDKFYQGWVCFTRVKFQVGIKTMH